MRRGTSTQPRRTKNVDVEKTFVAVPTSHRRPWSDGICPIWSDEHPDRARAPNNASNSFIGTDFPNDPR